MKHNQGLINVLVFVVLVFALFHDKIINGNDTSMKYITCTNTIYLENEPITNFSKNGNSIDVTLKDGTRFIADTNVCVVSSEKLEQGE